MSTPLARVILYCRDVEVTAGFYTRHFGFAARRVEGDGIVELVHPDGGAILMLHAASRGKKFGQTLVKLTFDCADVEGFVSNAKGRGLTFGSVHAAGGYHFSNGKDPDGNSISVTSRSFASGK